MDRPELQRACRLISIFGSSKERLDFTRLLGIGKYSLTAAAFALPTPPDR